MSPHDVIADIRRRYRADAPASDDDPYREMAGGLLPLLTDELYESRTHFFRELLQNADDNAYGPCAVPTLQLIAQPDALILRNNETGFEEKHVRALCNAAKSTKRDRKDGATGEKGIGFKAVFQVSDRPEVHSNGYHFRFDKNQHGAFGTVIPEWIEGADSPGTTIVLPLRKDYRLPPEFLKNLQPELLLFLRRLKRIEFQDVDYGQALVLQRHDDGPTVEVVRTVTDDVEHQRSGEHRHRFRVHRKRVSMADIQESRRANITASEVAVALALDTDGLVDERRTRELFAFLPVKDSGFRFLAHADFVLATSREAVREDLPWNLRLRDALGMCLAEAILECRSSAAPGATALRALAESKSASDPFLDEVLAQAITALSEEECVPTVGGGWVRPAEAIATDRGGLWQLVSDDDAAALLKKRYVKPGIDRIESALSQLGVGRFSLASLLACIGNEAWRRARDLTWFGQLYARLGAHRLDERQLESFKRSKVIILESSDTVAPASTTVFRSLGGGSRYGFEHELALLAPGALSSLQKDQLKQAGELLQRLDVTDATPMAIIERHLLKIHRSDDWEDCTDETLIGHAYYLRDHLQTYLNAKPADKREAARRDLAAHFTVLATATGDDARYTTASSLYLGCAYRDPNDLEGLFGSAIAAVRVSPEYLTRGHPEGTDAARKAWSDLFTTLGATDLPRVYFTADRTDYQWGAETAAVIQSTDVQRKGRLIAIIDRHWDGWFAQWKSRPGRGVAQLSSLLLALRSMQVATSSGAARLGATYIDSDDNRSVFGDAVPYLIHPLQCASLADALGVTVAPTVSHALARLRHIRDTKLQYAQSKVMVTALFRFLESRWSQHGSEIKAALEGEKLVLVDGAEGGTWATADECCWTLPREIRAYSPVVGLSGTWRDFQEFFCDKMGIPEGPDPDSLVESLEVLSKADLSHDQVTRAARAIYAKLRLVAGSSESGNGESWAQRLRAGLLIWTHHHQWWHNDDDVFAADDPSFEALFAAAPTVAFVNLPREDLTGHRDLLRLLGVSKLSEVIEATVPGDADASAWEDFRERLSERLRAIARFLHHKHPGVLEEAEESGAFEALKALDAQRCNPLRLDVSLKDLRSQHAFEARLINDGGRHCLYVDGSVPGYEAIGIEIGRLFGLSDTQSLPIGTLLEKPSLGDAERFLDKTLSVPDLPAEVARALFGGGDGEVGFAPEDTDAGEVPGAEDQAAEKPTPPARDPAPGAIKGPEGPPTAAPESAEATGGVAGRTEPSDASAPSHASSERGAPASAGTDSARSTDQTAGTPDGSENGQPDKLLSEGAEATRGGKMTDGALPPAPSARGASTSRSDFAATELEPDGPSDDDGEDARPTLPRNDEPGRSGCPPTRPDAPGRERKSRPPSERVSEQLRSRVVSRTEAEKSDMNKEQAAENARTAAAAIRLVLAWEERHGRTPTDENLLNPQHEGYDITSRGVGGTIARYIEVKGVDGAWGLRGVEVTPPQFEFAAKQGDMSWLYIVEHALSDSPVIHRIKDFARRVWRYGYDNGWREVAEHAASWPEPKEGMRVRLVSGDLGVVKRVFGAGENRGVEIVLEKDGSPQRVTWQPNRLTPLDDVEAT